MRVVVRPKAMVCPERHPLAVAGLCGEAARVAANRLRVVVVCERGAERDPLGLGRACGRVALVRGAG